WDEARHAAAALERYRELGGTGIGETYTGAVWRRWALGTTIEQKLAIQQVVQEGNALDATNELIEVFQGIGDTQTAGIFDFLMDDEALHARFGNEWILFLLRGDQAAYRKLIDDAAALLNTTVPRSAKPATELRLRAGFPPDFVKEMMARYELRRAAEKAS